MEEKCSYLFVSPRNAENILNIPLVPSLPEDVVVWHYSTNGRFSVKTAYALGMECRNRHMGKKPQSSKGVDGVWKLLWHSLVPPKVKHFRYRVCSLSLPTRVNLIKRVPIDSIVCPFCALLLETDLYVFVECDFPQTVWEFFGLDLSAIWKNQHHGRTGFVV